LPPRSEAESSDEVFNANEDYERISVAALLVVLQPYRARCTLSENDSMAGFGLPQASDSQIVRVFTSTVVAENERTQVTDEIKTGTVLVKEGAPLPGGMVFESEPCVPGWRLVKDLNGYALGGKIHEAGWTFFFLAGEIKSTVFGMDGQQMARRAIDRILRDPKAQRFNSLEIARLTLVGSARSPGVRLLTVAANLRHIQQSLFLFRAEKARESGASGNEFHSSWGVELASNNRLREETSGQPGLAAIPNP
jgi:hypothetical protein